MEFASFYQSFHPVNCPAQQVRSMAGTMTMAFDFEEFGLPEKLFCEFWFWLHAFDLDLTFGVSVRSYVSAECASSRHATKGGRHRGSLLHKAKVQALLSFGFLCLRSGST
jgi:hypothetical protein